MTVDPGEVRLDEIGKREVIHEKQVENRDATAGGFSYGSVFEKHSELSPSLTEEEALMLGKHKWHRYRLSKPGSVQYTCVINSRRFIVDESTFVRMRDGNMAEEEGID